MAPKSRIIDKRGIADLYPGYFALVMATGIVSLALQAQGWEKMARGLFYLNVCIYLACIGATGARIFVSPKRLFADLTHYQLGVTFLTTVAATNVLGCQVLLFGFSPLVARVLWVLGFLLCVVLTYAFFAAMILREPKPTLTEGINGAWLLIIVATESVVVLGTADAGRLVNSSSTLFLDLALFLGGFMLYLPIITLILYRWISTATKAETLTPAYWINMGALAITALAGINLLSLADRWPLIIELRSFLTGTTIFCWASATWWIPLLLILSVWKHLVQRQPLIYDPQYWSLVFPLGMYAYATYRMAIQFDLTILAPCAKAFTIIAALAWLLITWLAVVALFQTKYR